jgi:Putative transmembrane protein (PGPGW)
MLTFEKWNRFAASPPGQRFQERYRRKREHPRGRFARCGAVCAGIVLTLVGIFFLAVPGPGIPILAAGLALIAQESRVTARFLDRAELRVRGWLRRLRR